MKDRYVLLTGAKDNAGDFLIKARAKEVLAHLRPDRELLDWDRWKPLTEEQVAQVNESRALILCGGPALRPRMWPEIYPLVPDLERIRVPILCFGTGWKAPAGGWEETHRYAFSLQTHRLLQRVEASGMSSTRDYHSLNVLRRAGYRNHRMTGCPASYSLAHVGRPVSPPAEIRSIGFSLGVGFVHSASLEAQTRTLLEALRGEFSGARIVVALHHSDDAGLGDAGNRFKARHQELLAWLRQAGFETRNIAGTDAALREFYAGCDWHVGYRVHAHLFMSSISKPSVLLAEDGRGFGVQGVLGGLVLGAGAATPAVSRWRRRLRLGPRDPFDALGGLAQDVPALMRHEHDAGYPRLSAVRRTIDAHWEVMRGVVSRLP